MGTLQGGQRTDWRIEVLMEREQLYRPFRFSRANTVCSLLELNSTHNSGALDYILSGDVAFDTSDALTELMELHVDSATSTMTLLQDNLYPTLSSW